MAVLSSGVPEPWKVCLHPTKKKIYCKSSLPHDSVKNGRSPDAPLRVATDQNKETGEQVWTNPSEVGDAVPPSDQDDAVAVNLESKSPHTKSALRNDKDLLQLTDLELGSLCTEVRTDSTPRPPVRG